MNGWLWISLGLNAAGAAALLALGTELCRREDVERFYNQIVMRPVGETGRVAGDT